MIRPSARSAQRPSANRESPGPTSQPQPPPPVARPQTPLAPPAPPAPLVLELVAEPLLLLALAVAEALLLEPMTQLPFWHIWPIGQTTPAQGSLPHPPVTGSQTEPSVHGLGMHLSITQVGGICEVSQTWPPAQA